MNLYYVKHQHDAATCPAQDPAMGAQLLTHLSEANASRFGIRIHGDAVLDGQHTFVLILEAPDEEKVNQYMQPFQQAGPVEVTLASHCETVVDRGGC